MERTEAISALIRTRRTSEYLIYPRGDSESATKQETSWTERHSASPYLCVPPIGTDSKQYAGCEGPRRTPDFGHPASSAAVMAA
jgi:hypothetical protein